MKLWYKYRSNCYAATNRADVLDKDIGNFGRFDRQIYVDLPDLVERKEIFEVHLKPLKLSKDIDRNFLANSWIFRGRYC